METEIATDHQEILAAQGVSDKEEREIEVLYRKIKVTKEELGRELRAQKALKDLIDDQRNALA